MIRQVIRCRFPRLGGDTEQARTSDHTSLLSEFLPPHLTQGQKKPNIIEYLGIGSDRIESTIWLTLWAIKIGRSTALSESLAFEQYADYLSRAVMFI